MQEDMSVPLLIDVYARPSYQQTVTFPGNDLTTRKRITGSCVFSVWKQKQVNDGETDG